MSGDVERHDYLYVAIRKGEREVSGSVEGGPQGRLEWNFGVCGQEESGGKSPDVDILLKDMPQAKMRDSYVTKAISNIMIKFRA